MATSFWYLLALYILISSAYPKTTTSFTYKYKITIVILLSFYFYFTQTSNLSILYFQLLFFLLLLLLLPTVILVSLFYLLTCLNLSFSMGICNEVRESRVGKYQTFFYSAAKRLEYKSLLYLNQIFSVFVKL